MESDLGIPYADKHEAHAPSPMRDGLQALTEREKETLRLLVGGHDAKSIAHHLGLSVHTINERLRDARRKLDVSSSREAARLLAEVEQARPNFPADKHFGVFGKGDGMRIAEQSKRRRRAAHRLAWFGGGMLIMSLIIAAIALSSAFHGSHAPKEERAPIPASTVTSFSASESAGLSSARDWVALLDRQRWKESWHRAAASFKSQIPATQWVSTIQSVRRPLGPVSARDFQNVTKTSSLPGAPAGVYEVIQFQTNFASKSSAVETVVLVRDGSSWKVAGYFIR